MPDVTPTLHSILADHGVETIPKSDGWVTSNGNYPACRATVGDPEFHSQGCKVRMDVEIALSHDRVIVESFADFGKDPNDAFDNSLQNFCTGTLHVLLSALWGAVNDPQVYVEQYRIRGKSWNLHLGNIVRKAAGGADIPPPEDLIPIFDRVIPNLKLDAEVHWGRLFYANMPNGENIIEALIDNALSAELKREFSAANWARPNHFYSHRMFWILTSDVAV